MTICISNCHFQESLRMCFVVTSQKHFYYYKKLEVYRRKTLSLENICGFLSSSIDGRALKDVKRMRA